MNYPTRPEDLTAEWLCDVLDQPVTDFEVELFGEGAGIIGQVTRVHLTGANQDSIIAKFPSPAPENRAVAAQYNMYGREVNFYQRIADLVSLRTPDCYFAAHNPANEDFVLLLEDLKGYRIGDQVKGCNAADAEATVLALARFHASAWEPRGLDVPSHNNPAQCEGMMAGFQAGWPVVMEQFRDLIPAVAVEAAPKIPNAVGRLLAEMCEAPVALCHADVRLDNIFYGDGPDDVLFVDWQSVCTSAPEQDLAYFVTQSVPADVLASTNLLDLYFDELVGRGVDYSKQHFQRRYKVSALYLICYAVTIAGTLDLGNERGQALGRTLLGGSMNALEAMNAFALLEE